MSASHNSMNRDAVYCLMLHVCDEQDIFIMHCDLRKIKPKSGMKKKTYYLIVSAVPKYLTVLL